MHAERLGLLLTLLSALAGSANARSERLVVGSKNFTESHLLGELMTLVLEEHTELDVEHRSGLGGTLVCFNALTSGELDVYPDYTGTAWSVVLREEQAVSDPLQTFLHVQERFRALHDVEWLAPFGLNNTYAIAMVAERADALGIRSISDLARHQDELRAGLSFEFVHRPDGWAGLAPRYGLELREVRPMEHALAYEALVAGEIDVIDAYATDAKLLRYGLRVLEDDRGFFPPYHAAPLVRGELLRNHPEVAEALGRLAFRISDAEMIRLNHRVEVEGLGFRAVARAFLEEEGLLEPGGGPVAEARARPSLLAFLWSRRAETLRLFGEHVWLTFVAVLLAVLVALPVGILATRNAALRRVSLAFSAGMQTVPSLALLAFLIAVPGFGLSARSAIFALFLYALLPILRNTCTGIEGVDPDVVDAARGMGLTRGQVLLRIQLPLATRTIMAGVRTATVICIGVATLAAFIGAGGLGEPIVTGLYLNDTYLILSGAIPAALFAFLADFVLGRLERVLVPRGLRIGV